MPDPVKDETQQIVEGATDLPAAGAEVKDDSTTAEPTEEKTGAETDLAGATQEQSQFLEDLLVEHDVDSPEKLKELIDGLADLKDKLSGENIDELLDNKALMVKYQKHWAAQDAEKKKDGETAEETIARLEKENVEMQQGVAKSKAKQQESQEAKRLLSGFNSTVTKTIKTIKEVPDEYRGFFGLFMGVDNPINDIDLGDRAAVIDLTKKGAKKMMDFEQTVIKRYLEGKADVPKVTTTTDTSTEKEPVKIKNLSEARNALTDHIKTVFANNAAKKKAAEDKAAAQK